MIVLSHFLCNKLWVYVCTIKGYVSFPFSYANSIANALWDVPRGIIIRDTQQMLCMLLYYYGKLLTIVTSFPQWTPT